MAVNPLRNEKLLSNQWGPLLTAPDALGGKLPTYSLSVHERSAVTGTQGRGVECRAMVRAHKRPQGARSHGRVARQP